MSDCCNHKERKAIKDHKCGECTNGISKGDKYHYYSGVFDSEPFSQKVCAGCDRIAYYLKSQKEVQADEVCFNEIGLGLFEYFDLYKDEPLKLKIANECGVTVEHLNNMYK